MPTLRLEEWRKVSRYGDPQTQHTYSNVAASPSSTIPQASHFFKTTHPPSLHVSFTLTTMSHFRAKKLDLGGFINPRIVRDHTKRKVVEQFEQERYLSPSTSQTQSSQTTNTLPDKHYDTSPETRLFLNDCAIRRCSNCQRCIATHGRRRLRIDA